MWDNVEKIYIVERGRSQMIIWSMRVAYWITKATNTRLEYVLRVAFPLQQWLPEEYLTGNLHAQCVSCLNLREGFRSTASDHSHRIFWYAVGPLAWEGRKLHSWRLYMFIPVISRWLGQERLQINTRHEFQKCIQNVVLVCEFVCYLGHLWVGGGGD